MKEEDDEKAGLGKKRARRGRVNDGEGTPSTFRSKPSSTKSSKRSSPKVKAEDITTDLVIPVHASKESTSAKVKREEDLEEEVAVIEQKTVEGGKRKRSEDTNTSTRAAKVQKLELEDIGLRTIRTGTKSRPAILVQ